MDRLPSLNFLNSDAVKFINAKKNPFEGYYSKEIRIPLIFDTFTKAKRLINTEG